MQAVPVPFAEYDFGFGWRHVDRCIFIAVCFGTPLSGLERHLIQLFHRSDTRQILSCQRNAGIPYYASPFFEPYDSGISLSKNEGSEKNKPGCSRCTWTWLAGTALSNSLQRR